VAVTSKTAECAIVIPVYQRLSKVDKVTLEHNLTVLQSWDTLIIAPDNLCKSITKDIEQLNLPPALSIDIEPLLALMIV
jgi:hypothetical protein